MWKKLRVNSILIVFKDMELSEITWERGRR